MTSIYDFTEPGNEELKKEFEDYLKKKYPDHEWLVVNVINMDTGDVKFKQGDAYSKNSRDIYTPVVKNETTKDITDSFQYTVIKRQSTMQRWRNEMIIEVDKDVAPLYSSEEVMVYINYFRNKENIPKIKLDQELDPFSKEYKADIALYIKQGLIDPEEVSEMAGKVFSVIKDAGFNFSNYFVYMTREDYSHFNFEIPSGLIGSQDLKAELKNAISDPSNPINKIKHIE